MTTDADQDRPSLAVRQRPTTFEDVAGQGQARAILTTCLAAGTLPQQVLISGPSGLGKTTLARIAAASLLCASPDSGRACGACASCADVAAGPGRHLDLIEIDAASAGGKDEVRALAESAQLMPLRGPRKVYIVDESHGLTGPGATAFLKLLEEPPAHVTFFLATTDPARMPDALRSRCLELELSPPTREQILDRLRAICVSEQWTASDEILQTVLDGARPELGVRGAVTMLERLSGLLTGPTAPDVDIVRMFVGLGRREHESALERAITASDLQGVLTTADAVRGSSSEATLRTLLRRIAARLLRTHATEHDQRDRAAHALRLVLTAGPSEVEGDLLLAQLAAIWPVQAAPSASTTAASSPSPATTPDRQPATNHSDAALATARGVSRKLHALLAASHLDISGSVLTISANEEVAARLGTSESAGHLEELARNLGVTVTIQRTKETPAA